MAAIKYEKYGNYYAAKVNLRIVCLLDTDEVDAHLTLSPIGMNVHPHYLILSFSMIL